jgi:hypothetical protein
MNLEHYKLTRKSNITLDWDTYLKLNKDLTNNGINTLYKIIKHWFEYSINENRLYNDKNIELSSNWKDINGYLRTNKYKHTNVAFIITACIRNTTHMYYLTNCIHHIRVIYPDMHIYVINDNSKLSLDDLEGDNVDIIPSLSHRSGELNPYLFILDPRCKHDKLVYIHDTVFIKRNIDSFINRQTEIDFLWYTTTAISNDTFRTDNTQILNNLFLYFGNSKMSIYNFIKMVKIVGIPYTVKFGCMSVFTKRFMEKIDTFTNLRDVSKLFNCRRHRCFFERLLSILHIFIYGKDYGINNSLCGNIYTHPRPFSNTNINIPCLMPLVKVWQGR